jgi:hypothetical protein
MYFIFMNSFDFPYCSTLAAKTFAVIGSLESNFYLIFYHKYQGIFFQFRPVYHSFLLCLLMQPVYCLIELLAISFDSKSKGKLSTLVTYIIQLDHYLALFDGPFLVTLSSSVQQLFIFCSLSVKNMALMMMIMVM